MKSPPPGGKIAGFSSYFRYVPFLQHAVPPDLAELSIARLAA
ncbi:MAG: hypothetical protein AB7O26_19935 [Planctomycetaceae bacterium]